MNNLDRLDNSSPVLIFVAEFREEYIVINWGGLSPAHHVYELFSNFMLYTSFEKRVVVSRELVSKLLLRFGDVESQVGRPCGFG